MAEHLDRQREETAAYKKDLEQLMRKRKENIVKQKPPKSTLQKLAPEDDIKNFISAFEWIATQQRWTKDLWGPQLAGLLTGKARATNTSLCAENAADYSKIKYAIFQRYKVNEETYCRRFLWDHILQIKRIHTTPYHPQTDGLVERFNGNLKSMIKKFTSKNKKDGTVRFCVNYRKVNSVMKFDAYSMPRIKKVLESIGSAKVISTLDLAKGYWQIPLSEDAKEKTAFITLSGLYEFEVMLFGLHSAPATFQRTMQAVCRSLYR